jgi:hypothetical protein
MLGHMTGLYYASAELLGSKGFGNLLTQKLAREIRNHNLSTSEQISVEFISHAT